MPAVRDRDGWLGKKDLESVLHSPALPFFATVIPAASSGPMAFAANRRQSYFILSASDSLLKKNFEILTLSL
jgi:hypothetical protein